MKFSPIIFLGLFVLVPLGARADDPSKVDATQQNTRLAPTQDNADNRLAPTKADNQRPLLRDDHVQDSRFKTPEAREKSMAPSNDKKAPVEMKEMREKNMIDHKDYPKPDVRDRETNLHDGEKARIQPNGDMVKKYDTVSKYQNRINDAATAAAQRQPKLEKRTTFDKINRFIFQRNGPGEDGGKAEVTQAGGGTPLSSAGGPTKASDALPHSESQSAAAPAK